MAFFDVLRIDGNTTTIKIEDFDTVSEVLEFAAKKGFVNGTDVESEEEVGFPSTSVVKVVVNSDYE